MKTLLYILPLAAILSQLPSVCAQEAPPQETEAEAREVIASYFKAIGGLRRYLSIQSMLSVAEVREGPRTVLITTAREAPYNYRVESVPAENPQGGARVEGSNGKVLWYYDEEDEEPVIETEDWRYVQAYDFYGPLIDHERKGIVFASLGDGRFRGREATVLRAWYPNGMTEDLFFSADNGLMLGSRSVDPENPESPPYYYVIAQYQQHAGVYIPSEIHTYIGSKLAQTLIFTKITVNYSFNSSLFDPPDPAEIEVGTEMPD